MRNPFLNERRETNISNYVVVLNAPPPKPTVSILPYEEKPKQSETSIPVIIADVAKSAVKFETPQRISIVGDAAGSIEFDGSEDKVLELKVMTAESAQAAARLETPQKISIAGDAAGTVEFDGSKDKTLKLTVKSAERALKDGNGREISKTYVKKSELKNYVADTVEEKLDKLKENGSYTLNEEELEMATGNDIDDLF